MQWLKLITIILGLTCVAYSIEIVAKERSPGCNPVPENDEVILKVTTMYCIYSKYVVTTYLL